jgi:phosphatidylethanolamine/phosphatidyl-N-methylethanolamine N-methyltransferase
MTTLHSTSRKSTGTRRSRAAFVREFLRDPAATASVVPSSRKLTERMIEGIDLASCRSIIEFGPGSGVMTRVMLERLPQGWTTTEGGAGRFIAVEFNPRMAKLVAREHPRAIVATDSAASIERICQERGIAPGTLDAVVSGLGWASFPPELTTEILEATARMLRPGGHFRTFAYHIGLLKKNAWHLRAELRRLFTSVELSRGVWANLPPAFVYRCVK